jgi:DNA-binding beta-propeller fold protein YncE
MKRLWTALSTLVMCSGTLLGTTGEWQALVCAQQSDILGSVVPIGLSSYVEGDTINLDLGANAIAITPDRRRALVANANAMNVSVLDLTASPVTSYTVPLGTIGFPSNIAITPDGTKALVVCSRQGPTNPATVILNPNSIVVLDLTTTPVSFDPAVVYSICGDAIAITPDGGRALIGFTEDEGVSFDPEQAVIGVIDLTTTPISLQTTNITGVFDGGIAVTPDGKRALAMTRSSDTVTMIDLTATPYPQPIQSVTVAPNPTNLAITPDGTRALVIFSGDESQNVEGGVAVLNLAESSMSVELPYISLGAAPKAIAITPDGKRAVVTKKETPAPADLSSSDVVFLDLTTSPISLLPTQLFTIDGINDVAITPDQAPTARFTATVRRKRVVFDASASTSPLGSIATYAWIFGDGHTAITTSPVVAHTYHHLPKEKSCKDRPILVTLTVTNTGGTSTNVTFTGRTVSNNGGSSATTVQPLIAPPLTFVGTVEVDDDELLLKTRWTASSFEGVKQYEIFKKNKKIATISADDHLQKTIHVHAHHEENSPLFLESLTHKYRIRAVVNGQVVSPFVYLILE